VFICVLDFKQILRKLIFTLLKEFLGILSTPQALATGIPKELLFYLIGYSDSDYASCKIDRKSTSVGCNLLGRSLVSWTSKKQNCVALSTAEAEYIIAGACCTQIIYMKQTLLDYGVVLEKVPLLCDNESDVKLLIILYNTLAPSTLISIITSFCMLRNELNILDLRNFT
jgi:hypothetical protein